jgi:hypothetical protein
MVQELTRQSIYTLDWGECQKVARIICNRAAIHFDDKEDFTQDVLVEIMDRARQDSGGLTSEEMWRAAKCVRNRYWRTYTRASKISSLNTVIPEIGLELIETIADDKEPDLDALLDAKSTLEHIPPSIIALGKKMIRGKSLTAKQSLYLARFRKGEIKLKPNQQLAKSDNYHRRRAKGLCIKCGRESGNFACCPECREKQARRQREHQEEHRARRNRVARYWRKHGKCPKCGAIPEPGFKTCSTCRTKARKYIAGYRLTRKTEAPE